MWGIKWGPNQIENPQNRGHHRETFLPCPSMSEHIYGNDSCLQKWEDIHWFCNDCEVHALAAVNNSLAKDPTSFEVRCKEKMDKALDGITRMLSGIIEEGKEQLIK